MKNFLRLALLTLALTTGAGAQIVWSPIDLGTSAALSDLWLIPANRVYVSGHNGAAFASTNSGSKWTRLQLPLPQSDATISRLRFLTPEIGFGMGLGSVPTVYATTDGGATWRPIFTSGPIPMDFAFTSADAGVLSVRDQDTSRLLRTTDGGSTWNVVESVRGLTYYALRFRNATTGMALMTGQSGTRRADIVRTSDGGATWQGVAPCTGNCFGQALDHVVGSRWVAAIGTDVYSSDDDGATWSKTATLPTIDEEVGIVRAIDICAEGFGYAICDAKSSVFRTSDGGATWTPERVDFGGVALTAVAVPSPYLAYITGVDGILRRGFATSGVDDESASAVRLVARHDRPSGRIELTFMPAAGSRTLRLFDASGRPIAERAVEPGEKSATLAVGDLASGMYWCRLGAVVTAVAVVR